MTDDIDLPLEPKRRQLLPVPPLPKEIAQAIVKVQAAVGVLNKDDKNSFDGYKYASVDAFFAALAPICADASLVIYPSEVGHTYNKVETDNGVKVAATIEYTFTLIHAESGQTWSDPNDIREIRLWWKGARSYGEAQSYAVKQYMRGLFKVATGDRDADEDDQDVRLKGKDTAKINTERRGRGRTSTSKVVSMDFGNGKEVIAVDELRAYLQDFFADANPDRNRAWMVKNSDAMDDLRGYDKHLWLDVKTAVEQGKPL